MSDKKANSKIYLSGLLVLVISLFVVGVYWFKSFNDSPAFVAFSWSDTGLNSENIIPFYWMKPVNPANLDKLTFDAKTATDKMPSGHRVMISWDLKGSMMHPSNKDFLYTPEGEIAGCSGAKGFTPYISLWWDNGIKRTRQQFESFFKSYSSAGGKLDVLVLDFEQNFSYWHLKHLADQNNDCGLDAYLDAIQNDTRFLSFKEKLGFDDLKSLNQWIGGDEQLKWSGIVTEHIARYINFAVYAPLKKYYPDADFSNYGYYYQSSQINLPDVYGHYSNLYSEGVQVGTHQSRELYGWMNFAPQFKLEGINYPATPFNALRFAINKLRAMLLSSTVPVSPWVAYKGFESSHLKDNDYYQELIFHAFLSGVDYLLYWNPSEQVDFSINNDQLMDRLVTQLNKLVENRSISYQKQPLLSWQDDLLITKVQLENDQKLWRLTLKLEDNQSIMDFIEQRQPAKIRIDDAVLDFSGMQILETDDTYSDKGLWLISY